MRKILLIIIGTVLTVTTLTAQQNMRDVIYLKNGSIIKGIIIEQTHNVSYKIQTADGSIFIYPASEVEKITKENFDSANSNFNLAFGGTSELIYQNGNVFQNGRRLEPSQVQTVMANNSNALKSYNTGRTFTVIGTVIGMPCAAMFGWDLGGRMAGAEGNNTLLIVGATGTAVAILFELVGMSNVKKSVTLYNSTSSNSSIITKLSFGVTHKGVGFYMQF